jgi:hypothetical protein
VISLWRISKARAARPGGRLGRVLRIA